MTLPDRIGRAYVAAQALHCARVPGRLVVEVAGLTVASLGLPEPWSTHVLALPERPEPAAVDEALRWCRDHRLGPRVLVRAEHAPALPALRVVDELPVFVTVPSARQRVLDVSRARSAREFQRVYAAAFEMRPGLAEALVTDADLDVPGLTFLVGRADGDVVACAQLRVHERLGYVSAVGVVPERQRRGLGTAMLVAAGTVAGQQECDLLWLHASASSRPFYEGIGFELVDTHVALAGS